jgi:predicted dehydrogenase
MGRRAFLVQAGAAAAVAAPFAGFPAVVKRRRPNEMLCHAAIGCGNQAQYDLMQLASHRDLNVTALCDVDSRYLEQARRRFPGARIYRDAFEMFAKEGSRIDSVNVSTPDHTHAQYILEGLGRGLNVYAQKPLCHDLGDCRRIERLAAEKGSVTQMGTQIAAWECDRRTAAALRSGTIGEVRHVWLFSTRRAEPGPEHFRWPLPELPVPKTLDWRLWLGPAKWRPYGVGYHPGAWRKWREFGTSWLGDLGLHLMSPIWIGMGLGASSPVNVTAEVAADEWTSAQREQFWPSMSHVVWTMPGVKASGMKPFKVEWCDGFGRVGFRLEPKFLPPAFLQDVAALTPMK